MVIMTLTLFCLANLITLTPAFSSPSPSSPSAVNSGSRSASASSPSSPSLSKSFADFSPASDHYPSSYFYSPSSLSSFIDNDADLGSSSSYISPRDHVSRFITYGWGPGGRAMPNFIYLQNLQKCVKQHKDVNKCTKFAVTQSATQKRASFGSSSGYPLPTSYPGLGTSGLSSPLALIGSGKPTYSYPQSFKMNHQQASLDPLPSKGPSEDSIGYLWAPETYNAERYTRR